MLLTLINLHFEATLCMLMSLVQLIKLIHLWLLWFNSNSGLLSILLPCLTYKSWPKWFYLFILTFCCSCMSVQFAVDVLFFSFFIFSFEMVQKWLYIRFIYPGTLKSLNLVRFLDDVHCQDCSRFLVCLKTLTYIYTFVLFWIYFMMFLLCLDLYFEQIYILFHKIVTFLYKISKSCFIRNGWC